MSSIISTKLKKEINFYATNVKYSHLICVNMRSSLIVNTNEQYNGIFDIRYNECKQNIYFLCIDQQGNVLYKHRYSKDSVITSTTQRIGLGNISGYFIMDTHSYYPGYTMKTSYSILGYKHPF